MKTKVRIVMLFSFLSWIAICPLAMAHNLWLNPGDYYPKVGSTVDIGIGWGHKYPAGRVDQEVKEDRVEAISVIDPDGLPVTLARESAALYKLSIEKEGAYLITAKIKPGFFTTTSEGRKWGDKKSVEKPIKCTNFHINAQTVVIAGGTDKHLGHSTGQSLEVVPLSNPQLLKKGDNLSVKVLFDGKPLANAAVKATFAGFETEDIAPQGTPAKDAKAGGNEKGGKSDKSAAKRFPVETVTDEAGLASLPLNQAGYWMVMLSHKPPFADPQICDECMYNMAFTFQIQATP